MKSFSRNDKGLILQMIQLCSFRQDAINKNRKVKFCPFILPLSETQKNSVGFHEVSGQSQSLLENFQHSFFWSRGTAQEVPRKHMNHWYNSCFFTISNKILQKDHCTNMDLQKAYLRFPPPLLRWIKRFPRDEKLNLF